MLLPTALLAVCVASNTVLASGLDKPYYDLEDAGNLFKEYVKQYGKVYNRREYFERLNIFKESLKDINERNNLFPDTIFKADYFADLTPEEQQQFFGLRPSNETINTVKIPAGPIAAPDEFDWRKQGVVSHVKNQKHCGSCYIFSAVGNIEGQYALKHKQCLALSEGQALDCLDCGSCNGGIMVDVMDEFSQKAGVMKEDDYPYFPKKRECKEDTSKAALKVIKGQSLDITDEEVLKQNLHDIGPLAVAVDALDFFSYGKGILEPRICSQQRWNHAVLLVGYGEENGKPFWIIKNSWGKEWGEAGYVRLLRGVNACGIGRKFTATATVA